MAAPRFDYIRVDRERRRQELRGANIAAPTLAPDAAAQTWREGASQGLTPALALGNPQDVAAEAERRRLDRLATESPILADWIAERPERLAVARDELDGLAAVEASFIPMAAGGRYQAQAVDAVQQAGSEFVGYFGSVLTGLGDLNDAAARSIGRGIRALAGDTAADALEAPVLPWWADPSEIVRRPGQEVRAGAQAIGVPEERQTFVTDVGGGVGQLGGMVVQSLLAPQTMAPSLLALGASQQGDRVRTAGAEGTVEGDTAVLAGAGVTAALERFGLERLMRRLPPKVRNDTARWLADKGIAFAYEGGQEIAEGLAQNAITAATVDPEQGIADGVLYEGGVAGTSAAIIRTLLGARSPLRPVVESADDAARIETIHRIGELKTLERAPGEVEQLVRQIVDRTPGAPTHVYLDGETLATYFQGAGLDPQHEITQLTGDADAAAVAIASGGDVVIPIDRYVARAVKSPHADALKDMARLAADRVSNAELREIDVDALLTQPEPVVAPEAQVAERVQQQLEAAGVEKGAAAAQAQLLAQRYATRAERRGLGETALQVYEAAKLTIERPGEGPQPTGQRLEQAPETPEFRAWFGESQVVDEAGAPLVVYHGSPDLRFMDGDATFMSLDRKSVV